jgi:nitric oxide reductase NorD protein
MEEWVGQQWHRLVTRWAEPDTGAVDLQAVQRAAALLLHAAGASASELRIAAAAPLRVGGERGFWQRVAGSGLREPLAQRDDSVLALPARLAVFGDAALNRELYLWLALQAAFLPTDEPDWLRANVAATQALLAALPALAPRWQRLREALLALRGPAQDEAEAAVQAALRDGRTGARRVLPQDVKPVWCWVLPVAEAPDSRTDDADASASGRRGPQNQLAQRRRARQAETQAARAPLLLGAKTEWIKTFADPFAIDRAEDDQDEGDAATAAEELAEPTLQRGGERLVARVRFDLDLPAAAQDDLPQGEPDWLPEWDPRSQQLLPQRVQAQVYTARQPQPWQPAPALRAQGARLRRRLAIQQAAPRWQRGLLAGEELDLDAWVRHAAHPVGPAAAWQQVQRQQRELASLLLADLSISTDAHANNEQRVIEVIRDSLYLFGEALHASGDAFALLGFSSVRRNLRLHELKRFDERWSAALLPRLGALQPGYYTRLGAALRAATQRLKQRPERQRLLILLTDGKPHDLDGYEGRLGREDTREAVREARAAGLVPFAVSIDSEAPELLPQLFGAKGFAWVRRPADLPQRLTQLYASLSR